MKSETKKRVIWLAVFMVWIGMVSSILVYQNSYSDINSSPTQNIQPQNNVSRGNTVLSIEDSSVQHPTTNMDTINIQTPKPSEDPGTDFFVEQRLIRDKARSELINSLRDTVNNPNVDPSFKKTAQEELLNLTKKIENEMQIEGQIRSRGFKDVLANIYENKVNLLIYTEGLTEAQVVIIGDIVIRITSVRLEDISILEYKKR